ncbi:hypothetical protein CRG98_042044 [Punica granatum]|uniref:CCHC-type domain-containing protein n=1 Tax=Punica granatum TaxID=22663 RepID=A0A2I0I156_PUNGR|nr:hypothetical protein CRG98_042044 [Punica granatum]
MATMKVDIEKFDGIMNFSLWRVRMTAILVQNDLKKAMTGNKPERMEQSEWDELDEKELFASQLCLTNNVLREVLAKKKASALWRKLEALYMTKSLANRLALKHQLYTFRIAKGQNRSRSKSRNNDKSCCYCKKKGHIVGKCYKLKNKQKAELDKKGKQKADLADASIAENKDDES